MEEAAQKNEEPSLAICGRCAQAYPPEDRRAQFRGPALCRSCHLDPGLRQLAISISEGPEHEGQVKDFLGWIRRCLSSLMTIIVKPGACFRAVKEPVALAPWVGFLLTLAAPSWLAVASVTALEEIKRKGPRLTFSDPRWLDLELGSAGVDALDLWTLAMLPLGLLALFFCAGTLAHLLVLLTGPSSRTLGASLRAMAISWVPILLLEAPLELVFRVGWIDFEGWLLGALLAGFWSLALLALGLARSHHTALIRGWVAAPLPWILVQACVVMRVVFAMKTGPLDMGV